MFDSLGLPGDMTVTLEKLYLKAKEQDPQLSEQRFLQVIIGQWLELFAQTDEKLLHKDKVVLRNDLKMAIMASGKTQRQISQETGINYVYLSDLVRGKYEPGITTVLLLMNALGYPPAKLYDLFFLEPIP